MKTLEQDKKIIELLKVTEIRRIICDTDKGFLKLLIRKGESKYHLQLDSVPLDNELNKELMELLFPTQLPIPQVNKEGVKLNIQIGQEKPKDVLAFDNNDGTFKVTDVPKKKGRPASKKK